MMACPAVAHADSPTRADPRRFEGKQDPGTAGNHSIVHSDSGTRAVFISYGACVASSLTGTLFFLLDEFSYLKSFAGRQDHDRKSVSIAPFCLDGLRLSGFVGNILGENHLVLNMFRGGLSISTKVSRSVYDSSRAADPTSVCSFYFVYVFYLYDFI